MNETVLERLAHLEGKLKEMEEENKSLSLRIADFESPTLEASRDFGVQLIEGNDKRHGFTPVCRLLVFSWLSPSTSRRRQFDFSNGGVRRNRRGVFIAWPEALDDISSGRTVLYCSCQAALGLEGRRCVRSHRTCTVCVLKDICYLGGFFGLGAASFVSMAKQKGHIASISLWPCHRALRSTRQHGWSLIAWTCKCSDQPVFYNNPWHTHSTRAATHSKCLLGYLRVDWPHFCHRFGADVCLIRRSGRRSRGWLMMTSCWRKGIALWLTVVLTWRTSLLTRKYGWMFPLAWMADLASRRKMSRRHGESMSRSTKSCLA